MGPQKRRLLEMFAGLGIQQTNSGAEGGKLLQYGVPWILVQDGAAAPIQLLIFCEGECEVVSTTMPIGTGEQPCIGMHDTNIYLGIFTHISTPSQKQESMTQNIK